MSRSDGLVAGGIYDVSGADIDGDVALLSGIGSDDEGIGRAADGCEGALGAVADVDVVGIKTSDWF